MSNQDIAGSELRQKIYKISLTPIRNINDGVKNPPGSYGLSDSQIDQIIALIQNHDTEKKQQVLKAIGENTTEDVYTPYGHLDIISPADMEESVEEIYSRG